MTRPEIEEYTSSLENIAAGEYDNALNKLELLQKKYPQIHILKAAIAAVKLLQGQEKEARRIFLQLKNSGYQLSGSDCWNLACAEIRLNNAARALEALRSCSQTEYRTKSEVWMALRELGDTPKGFTPPEVVPPPAVATPLTIELPGDVEECRWEVLQRLFVAKKVQKAYRPDLRRLAHNARQQVSKTLDEAYQATDPMIAAQILLPLLDQHPELFTLKVHAAARLLLAGNMDKAQRLYEDAKKIQHLDKISRFNLARIYLKRKDLRALNHLLGEAVTSPLNADFKFWLALVCTRALLGQKESAGEAAGRALDVSRATPNEHEVNVVLKGIAVRPKEVAPSEPAYLAAVRTALECLKGQDPEGATRALSEGKIAVGQIPEIGSRVFKPVLFANPGRAWDKSIADKFKAAVKAYYRGHFRRAANVFRELSLESPFPGLTLNYSAALLKNNEFSLAGKIIREALDRYKNNTKWVWRLTYNLILSYVNAKSVAKALSSLTETLSSARMQKDNFERLFAAVYVSPELGEVTQFTEDFEKCLSEIKRKAGMASAALLLFLAWAKLAKNQPEISGAQAILEEIMSRTSLDLLPAAEVQHRRQVREAFEHYAKFNAHAKAVDYLKTIVEVKGEEREDLDVSGDESRQFERLLGVEIYARFGLVRSYHRLREYERAIRELDEAESILKEYADMIAPGLLTLNCVELAQLAKELNLPWAARRYCRQGLQVDREEKSLGDLLEQLDLPEEDTVCQQMRNVAEAFTERCSEIHTWLKQLSLTAPVLARALGQAFMGHARERSAADLEDSEDLYDRLWVLGRMELPEAAQSELDRVLNWIIAQKPMQESLGPLEISVFQQTIWPNRLNDRAGSYLLFIKSRQQIANLIIKDDFNRLIWSDPIEAGKNYYVRGTWYQDEEFTPGESINLSLTVIKGDANGERHEVVIILPATIPSQTPRYPNYPTGALAPEYVPGGKLFGRESLIQSIIGNFQQERCQCFYFLQAPRQMGKTSVLQFVANQAPSHVFPVYVNLELDWSKKERDNIWNYLYYCIEKQRGTTLTERHFEGKTDEAIQTTVADICQPGPKKYVLLLLDEFHFLIERSLDYEGVLATFRGYLNNPNYRMALFISDRYTRRELMTQCPTSEIWMQLRDLHMGPLSREATKKAITSFTQNTDLNFLPETLEKIYYFTQGYPYHIMQVLYHLTDRLTQNTWVTALPEDIDQVADRIVEEDMYFNQGLCREDRIDVTLAEAIAALLEWRDLCEFLPILADDLEKQGGANARQAQSLRTWQPNHSSFLAHLPDPARVTRSLQEICIMNSDGSGFFSPLLENWLKKKRQSREPIAQDFSWTRGHVDAQDGAGLPGQAWHDLDVSLYQKCQANGRRPPLNPIHVQIGEWNALVSPVSSEPEFNAFLNSAQRLVVEGREEKQCILDYPWLFLTYHRFRLVRNFFVHGQRTGAAASAWKEVSTAAMGGGRRGQMPISADDWRAIQVVLLRSLYAALKNAIEVAGRPI